MWDNMNNAVAKLGFGLMRLPMQGENIDIATLSKMVDAYMAKGFNYFDTAYVYHGGLSERAAKEALVKRHPRDSFQLATKLPGWALKEQADVERVFNEQLERCGVDYFDLYLLHNVTSDSIETYERFDCFNWLIEKKNAGQMKHIGFSCHDGPEFLDATLTKYPQIEFVQLQVNYIDWDDESVRARRNCEIVRKHGKKIIIMEPVKGGTLAALPAALESKFTAARPNESVASWAIRYAASVPGVITVLSGMSNPAQMNDNLKTMDGFKPMTTAEAKIVEEVVAELKKTPCVPCTSCKYCVDGCPAKIKINEMFSVLNNVRMYGKTDATVRGFERTCADAGKPADCLACGQCEGVCPQHLPIIELLKELDEKMN